jgi:hypothetical protein
MDQAFARAITQTDWLTQVGAEYGVQGATWGGSVTIGTDSIADGGLDQAGANAAVEEAIDAGAPSPNGQTVYMVFPPPGVLDLDQPDEPNRSWKFTAPGSQTLGDHVLVTYTGEPGENNNTSAFDFMTASASQGLIDLLTHPWTIPAPSPLWSGSFAFPWFPARVGLLAHDSRTTAGGFVFQRVWSNAQAKRGGDPLLPAADEPYFNTVASPSWVTTAANQVEQVSFTGWATGSVSNWTVETWVFEATGGFTSLLGTTPGIDSGLGAQANSCGQPAVNDGTSATLTLHTPANVASGDYAIVGVASRHPSPTTCLDPSPSDGDTKHWEWVGFYVP